MEEKENAESIARVVWEANRQLQIADGEDWPDEPWDAAPDERKALCIGTVNMVCAGGVRSPAVTHEFWAAGMILDGWRWSHEKRPEQRTHPSLIPWKELSPRAQLGQRLLVLIASEMMQAEADVL